MRLLSSTQPETRNFTFNSSFKMILYILERNLINKANLQTYCCSMWNSSWFKLFLLLKIKEWQHPAVTRYSNNCLNVYKKSTAKTAEETKNRTRNGMAMYSTPPLINYSHWLWWYDDSLFAGLLPFHCYIWFWSSDHMTWI